jgi:NTP pyrophosphatase (non-canonical NTP hydrolase)
VTDMRRILDAAQAAEHDLALKTMPPPGTAIQDERCFDCGKMSGNDWSQCGKGPCSTPMSPLYDPVHRMRMIAAARAIDANPPTHRYDFETGEAVPLTSAGADDLDRMRVVLDRPDLVTDLMTDHGVERRLPRDQRQDMIANWAELAFGREEATGLPQRGLRLLEEAIEAFQATGGDEAIAHKLVAYVFARPPGTIGQELGGVAVTVLALAAAAGLSADEEECREIHRVLSKPLREFAERNANKNAAGFKIEAPGVVLGKRSQP